MALFRKFFYRKPPDGLLEISERVYVFDCCFTTDILEDEEYKVYLGGIVGQLHDYFPDASFMVFNFREGESQSQISQVLSEYDMTVMEYPRHYEGCPLLTMEMVHHFLRSSESWLSLGQQNVLLMHCERGGWPVLAFMLAALLLYRKHFTGEQKTLDMIYKQAPRELLQLISPLNPLPSQLRYLQYVSRRNVGSEWPPLDRALTLECIILRVIPSLDGEGGCRPIFRIYGQDPLMVADRTPKVLFSTPKKSKLVRHYKQADCELVKIDIHCHIQGDVVLECISLDSDQEREEMMFRVMFNTAFIRSNILMLNRDEIDILWNAKDQFPKDFRAEVLFSEMNTATSLASIDLSGIEEKDGLPIEAFAKVKEIFSNVDWLDPKSDFAVNMLQHIKPSNITEENLETGASQNVERGNIILESALDKDKEQVKLKALDNIGNCASIAQGKEFSPSIKPSVDANSFKKKIVPQELQVALQRPAQSKIISQRLPQTSLSASASYNSLQVSPVPVSKYHSAPSSPGITALLHDHDKSNNEEVTHQVTRSLPTTPTSASVTNILKPRQLSHLSAPTLPPPPPPSQTSSLQSSLLVPKTIQKSYVTPLPPPPPPPPLPQLASKATQSLLAPISGTISFGREQSSSDWSTAPPTPSSEASSTVFKKLHSTPPSSPSPLHCSLETSPTPPPPPPSLSGSSSSSVVNNSFSTPPPPPPPSLFSGTFQSSSAKSSLSTTLPPPSPPSFSGTSLSSSPKNSFSTPPPPPLPPSFSGTFPSSTVKNSFSAPPPPPPPPLVASSTSSSISCPPTTKSLAAGPPPPPPPPPPSHSRSLFSTSSALPPPPHPAPSSLSNNSAPAPPAPPPPAPFAKGLSSSKASDTSPSHSGVSNGNIPSIPGPPGAPFSAKGRGLTRTGPRNQSQPRKNNLKPYHWLKLTRAMQGSLWAEAQKSDEASKAPEFDMSELESLFSAAAPNTDNGGNRGKSSRRVGPKSEKVQLVELRRAYNCEIMLTKVKIPLPDLMSSVLALDDSAMDVDQVDNLIKFCPTKEEMELLKNYKGDKENLGKCEQFFLELMKVPRVESKLRVFSFKMQFHSQVSDLRKSLNIINSASEEVRSSVKLKRIMQTILSLGNALNHGTARGAAVGFRLDSLLKLTDTRARNNKMTLMHYLCKVLAEKLPELLDFAKDLVSLEASTKIQLKFLAEEMQAISKGLEKVVQELSASENDGLVSQNFCKILKEFLGFAEGEVRSLASLYSSVGRNADALAQYFGEDPARCPFEQVVSTLQNFVRMFIRAHDENCKQLEFEKKKAAKEAEKEKLKMGPPKKQSEHLMQSPLKSSTIK
ncbi:Formin-like protein [Melia azedarach]|uniref:Formin-like protein n=2 Tax=Melia azedarach TaxID=155640 RepID=A0ACC1XAL6_MELAZ|nr:Formin-like protein [Melia azedarach]KAJ4707784.1 Formin-like protein [Melia azedarach]